MNSSVSINQKLNPYETGSIHSVLFHKWNTMSVFDNFGQTFHMMMMNKNEDINGDGCNEHYLDFKLGYEDIKEECNAYLISNWV